MTLNKVVAALLICVAWCETISAASYSQVFVNSGQNGVPYKYVQYGTPAVAYGAPVAQLTAAPAGSLPPLPQNSNFVPCPAPCISAQQVVPIANAGLITYKAPVVVAKDDPPTPYQYSYAVYDDNTGDQKAQKESSDNGVVRGQYSFLQPDGYVRQVQYSADDVTGFNAIVNYLLPNGVVAIDTKQANNCDEPKSEALEEASKHPEATAIESKENHRKKDTEVKKEPKPGSSEMNREKQETADDKKEPLTDAHSTKKEPVKEPAPEVNVELKEAKPKGEPTETEAVVTPVAAPQPAPSVIPSSGVPPSTVPFGYISYDQLLNCLQKMQQLKNNSPLTYIILPSKPC